MRFSSKNKELFCPSRVLQNNVDGQWNSVLIPTSAWRWCTRCTSHQHHINISILGIRISDKKLSYCHEIVMWSFDRDLEGFLLVWQHSLCFSWCLRVSSGKTPWYTDLVTRYLEQSEYNSTVNLVNWNIPLYNQHISPALDKTLIVLSCVCVSNLITTVLFFTFPTSRTSPIFLMLQHDESPLSLSTSFTCSRTFPQRSAFGSVDTAASRSRRWAQFLFSDEPWPGQRGHPCFDRASNRLWPA